MAVKEKSDKGFILKEKSAVASKANASDNAKFELLDLEKESLKKLTKTPIIMNFIKKKDGCWNHNDWLEFLSEVRRKGFNTVDPDQIGMLLEEKKAQYLAAKSV